LASANGFKGVKNKPGFSPEQIHLTGSIPDLSANSMKILIVYGTKFGWTGRTAEYLGEVLQQRYHHKTMVSDYKLPKGLKRNINEFDLVIAGSSIVSGMWKPGVKSFLRKYSNEIKKLAIFVTAASTLQRAVEDGQSVEEGRAMAKDKYIEPVKSKYQLTTITESAFGGQKGKEHKIKFNNWKKEDIADWAEEINGLLN
jgi:hypothetical protein